MPTSIRTSLAAAAALIAVALVPASAEAAFGVTREHWEAGTCEARGCEYSSPRSAFYTQAAGHPEWGITAFELNHSGSGATRDPEGALKRIRVDIPPGLAADPQALPKCARAQFESDPHGCPAASQVGETELEAAVQVLGLAVVTPPLTGQVYNLEQQPGLPLLFGIDVEPAGPVVSATHLLLEGHVSDSYEPALAARGIPSGDYHEYFEINNIPTETTVAGLVRSPLKVLKSKLLFRGRSGNGDFLTLPSTCAPSTTSYLEVESYEGAVSSTPTVTPVSVEGCDRVPFAPEASVTPETARADTPDGATIHVRVPQHEAAGEINTADIRDVNVTLPPGMTLNPPAAGALGVCTAAQFAATCPESSRVGSVDIETDLPPHTLTGAVYLGSPSGATITGPPFTLYLQAFSTYGVAVRLQGQVTPEEGTGRLHTTFLHNPQLPFSELAVELDGGAHAPVANPLACATGLVETFFAPYTGSAEHESRTPFATEAVGGGACPRSLPFALSQATHPSVANAGAFTSFTFDLGRKDGQQYLSQLATTLPSGLVGMIPSVPLCGEAQANAGSCPEASRIGTATAGVGAGEAPLAFSGPVYLTGPYDGSPYGLSVRIEAAAGHFDLGRVVTRAGIAVEPYSGRVVVGSALPTIVKGVPLRLRSLSVAVTRSDFLVNPTSCAPLSASSTLTSTAAGIDALSSPFQVGNCGALAFKPAFAVGTDKRNASRANGIGLEVTMTQPAHEANIRSVVAQLPLQLPSRLTTLQKACLAATFAASPTSCPAAAVVGTAAVSTPVLPAPLTGIAYLVATGGAQFPNLDLVLEGDGGVRVILVGSTAIRNGVTTSTFAGVPDVPVSRFTLRLPVGSHSALASYGNLCAQPLLMPTTITAQNGAVFRQSTRIAVTGCGVRIVSRRVRGRFLLLTVQTYAPGSVAVSGSGLARGLARRLPRATTTTLRIPLARRAAAALHRRHHRVRLAVSVLFTPSDHGEPLVRATTSLTLHR